MPVLFLLFLFSCSKTETRQRKAEMLVKKYMETALDDPSSYEPIGFDTLDSIFEIYELSPEHEKIEKRTRSLDSLKLELEVKSDLYLINHPRSNYSNLESRINQIDKDKKLLDQQDSIEKSKFKGAFKYMGLTHEYRAKNKFGAVIKTSTDFTFDKDVTEIIHTH